MHTYAWLMLVSLQTCSNDAAVTLETRDHNFGHAHLLLYQVMKVTLAASHTLMPYE